MRPQKFYVFPLILLILLVGTSSEIFGKSKVETILPDFHKNDPGWGSDSGLFKTPDLIENVDETSSQDRLKEAMTAYNSAVEMFQLAEMEVEKKREDHSQETNLEDRYEWQKQAREEARKKEYSKIILDGRNNSVQFLIRGMKALDKIENPKVKESKSFLEVKAGLYREYVKHQYSMRNYIPTIEMLTKYISLDDKYYNESEAHKILAFCYEKLEQSYLKNKKISLYEEFKEKKKRHLLVYAELHYGKDTAEYATLVDKVMKDI
jgi:hypothetical protein